MSGTTIENTGAVSDTFESRKRKILADLSIPDEEYTDLSPKGSVDEGIQGLIQDINALPGLVTTSSCAGRISVFLEGRKKQAQKPPQQQQKQFAPSGGKGAGRWLYVSHNPLEDTRSLSGEANAKSLHEMFGLVSGDGKPPKLKGEEGQAPRLVRFHFDPMILHIMASTLQRAQPVLSAASSSGFRESGLQSLRCLDEDSEGVNPIVAVRSSGISLESIIGYCDENSEDNDDDVPGNEPVVRSLVTEEYLEMLVAISNERFTVNTERKDRFRSSLLELCSPEQARGSKTKGKPRPSDWEDPETRRERKKAEGLMRKKLLESQAKAEEESIEAANREDD